MQAAHQKCIPTFLPLPERAQSPHRGKLVSVLFISCVLDVGSYSPWQVGLLWFVGGGRKLPNVPSSCSQPWCGFPACCRVWYVGMPSGEDLNCLIHSGLLKATDSHWARPSQGKKKKSCYSGSDSWELVGTWALTTTHFHLSRANAYLRSSGEGAVYKMIFELLCEERRPHKVILLCAHLEIWVDSEILLPLNPCPAWGWILRPGHHSCQVEKKDCERECQE